VYQGKKRDSLKRVLFFEDTGTVKTKELPCPWSFQKSSFRKCAYHGQGKCNWAVSRAV